MALVHVTAKIEKNKPFDRAKKERIYILGRALVRIRTKKKEKKTALLVGLWLEEWQK